MKNKIIASVWLLAGIVLSSCSRTQLLRSTFENDAVGSQPNLELPGDPVGDRMQYQDVIAPRIRVQNSTIAGEKALHFSQIRVGTVVFLRQW
ncbi:hypothetical protein ACS5NO_05520 [Larkinella sp. GY13]|uniref:hypothetical protein n=1 Tax=Larkinella sp. GY13 TaxID=3453720 RepID=UPI003EEF81EF